MDDLSHILFSVLLTLFFYSKDARRRALILCAAIGSVLPDIDIIFRFFGEGIYLVEHRGLTHSLIGMALLPPLLAYLFSLRYSGEFKKFFDVSFLSIIGHVLLDLPTSWGTMLLWPFSYHRFTTDWMFIIDPFLLIFLLLGVIGYFITKREVIVRIAMIAIILHYVFLAYMHGAVIDVAHKEIVADQYDAIPTFASPSTWEIIASNQTHYLIATYTLFPRSIGEAKSIPHPTQEELIQAESVEDLRHFLRFSRFPYVETSDTSAHDEMTVSSWKDLRFRGHDFLVVDVQSTTSGFHGNFR